MEKEEFPTFLNEQPTLVFGRTTRELMIILIGLTLGYIVWTSIGSWFGVSDVGVLVLQGIGAAIPCIAALVVALVNVQSRRLEEWAAISLFYFFMPKVYVYMPLEEEKAMDDLAETYFALHQEPTLDDHLS